MKKLENKTTIQWYESQLTEEQLEEVRRRHISDLNVNLADESYIHYLVRGYQEKLNEMYYEGIQRSGR